MGILGAVVFFFLSKPGYTCKAFPSICNMSVAHVIQLQGPTEPALNQHVGKLLYLRFDLL